MSQPVSIRMRGKWIVLLMSCLVFVGTGIAWLNLTCLRGMYYARQVQKVPLEQKQDWADKFLELGPDGLPFLLDLLKQEDAEVCESVRLTLDKFLAEYSSCDPQITRLIQELDGHVSEYSSCGKSIALQAFGTLFNQLSKETQQKIQPLVAESLRTDCIALRIQAIQLAQREEFGLLKEVLPLLKDTNSSVRKAALLAVSTKHDEDDQHLIPTEYLLQWLHDPDGEVRRTCELALRNRGLTTMDISLTRQATHQDPSERIKVLLDLPDDEDFKIAGYLQRLSTDSEPAIRIGAARLAVERNLPFADRLEEMSKTDPDEDVRKLTEHYQKRIASQR